MDESKERMLVESFGMQGLYCIETFSEMDGRKLKELYQEGDRENSDYL